MPPLPFTQAAELLESNGQPVAGVSLELSPIWPAQSGAVNATGRAYDHRAEAPAALADALQVPNRRVRVGATAYTIIDATPHEFLPHTELRLREVRPGG